MKINLYQQSRTITAPRSRNNRFGISRSEVKTDFVYLTDLPSTTTLEVLEKTLVYFEQIEGFNAMAVTYVNDSTTDKWTIKFTVAYKKEDLTLDFTADTDNFDEPLNIEQE